MNQKLSVSDFAKSDRLWAIYPQALDAALTAIDADLLPRTTDQVIDNYLQINADGLAVVRIFGPMLRGASPYDLLFGDVTDMDLVTKALENAVESETVRGILLHIDSPGGTVDGTKELADFVAMVNEVKPVQVFSDGMIASAAFWVASAAERITSTETAQIGSIGVVAMHVDESELDKKIGIKRTYVYNGKFKRIANDAEPLSEEARKYLQERVDAIYDIFVNDVAEHRGVSSEKIIGQESKVYLSKAAQAEGLVDEVSSFNAAYTSLLRRVGIMNKAELKSDFGDLYSEVLSEGMVGATKEDLEKAHADKVKEWMEAGGKAERERISDIQESAFDGQEKLVAKLIKDGVTADEARRQLIADQKAKTQEALDEIEKGDTGDLGAGSGDDDTEAEVTADSKKDAGDKLDGIATDIRKAEGIPYSEAFQKARAQNPALAKVYDGK